MISEQEFKDWLQHPVTLAMRALLEQKRETLRRQWEGGAFTDYTNEGVALTNVANIGTCRGYAFVQELEYEDFLTESDDGESKRTNSSGGSSVG